MREEIISSNEKKFILVALEESKRLDGRRLEDMRNVQISFGSQPGVAEVLLGTTRVLAKVTGEMVTPYPDRPTEGFFTFNLEFSPMANPAFSRRQLPSDVVIGRILEGALRNSRAVDTEALCVIPGQKVWSIRADVHILDDGGNLTDCVSLGTVAALRHFRRNDITIQGESVIVHPVDERDPVPLTIHHMPISVTFAFFGKGDKWLVDPVQKEETVCTGIMSVIVNSHGDVCGIHKGGGVAISTQTLFRCIELATEKVSALTNVVEAALVQTKDGIRRECVRFEGKPVDGAATAVSAACINDNMVEDHGAAEAKIGKVSVDKGMFEGGQASWEDELSGPGHTMTKNYHSETALEEEEVILTLNVGDGDFEMAEPQDTLSDSEIIPEHPGGSSVNLAVTPIKAVEVENVDMMSSVLLNKAVPSTSQGSCEPIKLDLSLALKKKKKPAKLKKDRTKKWKLR